MVDNVSICQKKYGLAAVVFMVDNISMVIYYGLYIYIYIYNQLITWVAPPWHHDHLGGIACDLMADDWGRNEGQESCPLLWG